MLSRTWSASLVGLDAIKVGVEVDIAGGLPGVVVVGLPRYGSAGVPRAGESSSEKRRISLSDAGRW